MKKYLLWDLNDGNDYLISPEEVIEKLYVDGNCLVMDGVSWTDEEKERIEKLLATIVDNNDDFNINDPTEVEEYLKENGYNNITIDHALDVIEKDDEKAYFDTVEMKFVPTSAFETVKEYSWWNGSNWTRWILYPGDTETVVELTEDYVNLDEWDGRNHVTGGVGLHEKLHKVVTIDGQKVEETFLLIKTSQWQGEHAIAEILNLEDVKSHLQSIGRDVEQYMYEVGKLSGE